MEETCRLAARYADFLPGGAETLREEGRSEPHPELPREDVLQSLWLAGLLGREGETAGKERVEILDFGVWNRSAGPDFLHCEIRIGGRVRRGAVELDVYPENWERHGHGSNPDFDEVVLHVAALPARGGTWFTRNSRHEEVPLLVLGRETVAEALSLPGRRREARCNLCRAPLAAMKEDDREDLLKAAAAYRFACKRKAFERRKAAYGASQAWYESWAETLGYSVNKDAMWLLARRAPLARLEGDAEAVLFGTAGFLVPVLPERTGEEARAYHADVWGRWWSLREAWELGRERSLPWRFSGVRPQNHPHRRLGALVVCVREWETMEKLLTVENSRRLVRWLTSLEHPYWSRYFSLPSAPLKRRTALVGETRARDFLINHVYPCSASPHAWKAYCSLHAGPPPSRVKLTARHLFGEAASACPPAGLAYVQQALLQIREDFCVPTSCQDCLFPEQLRSWKKRPA